MEDARQKLLLRARNASNIECPWPHGWILNVQESTTRALSSMTFLLKIQSTGCKTSCYQFLQLPSLCWCLMLFFDSCIKCITQSRGQCRTQKYEPALTINISFKPVGNHRALKRHKRRVEMSIDDVQLEANMNLWHTESNFFLHIRNLFACQTISPDCESGFKHKIYFFGIFAASPSKKVLMVKK